MMTIFGTRPEAIKMAPLVLTLKRSPDFEPIVVVTAQHREMLDQVLELFHIVPDYDLGIQRDRQSLAEIAARSLAGLDPIVEEAQPDIVMVQGDTTTTMAGALAAFYRRIPVAHVEAGLRTHDRYSPYPEEINRRVTTQLANLHLTPTLESTANLVAEGVAPASIVCTGNSVIDALDYAVSLKSPYADPLLVGLDEDPRRVLLVTVHRRESWGEVMVGIGRALARLARTHPEMLIVVPLHLNPKVREDMLPSLAGVDNVVVIPPLPYGSFARLIDRAYVVLTDSGGIQEEAPSRGKPVLVLRDKTERPEAVSAGTAALIGTDETRIVEEVEGMFRNEERYRRMSRAVNPYGDGRAAERTHAALRWYFDLGERPSGFRDVSPLAAITPHECAIEASAT